MSASQEHVVMQIYFCKNPVSYSCFVCRCGISTVRLRRRSVLSFAPPVPVIARHAAWKGERRRLPGGTSRTRAARIVISRFLPTACRRRRRGSAISWPAAAGGDHRSQERVEHPVGRLVAQRLFGLVLGYEDLNDHDELRDNSLLAVECDGLTGENRGRDRGHPLAPEPAGRVRRA